MIAKSSIYLFLLLFYTKWRKLASMRRKKAAFDILKKNIKVITLVILHKHTFFVVENHYAVQMDILQNGIASVQNKLCGGAVQT